MKSNPAPLAVTIPAAAESLGMSRSKFYTEFLNTGRVRPVKVGKRGRAIDAGELKDAWDKYRAELRAVESETAAA
jgi:hypothetical protein